MTRHTYGRHTIEITNEDKVLFPDDGITKGDLIDYYEQVADTVIRYLRDRPLVMRRFPDGISKEGFYQKQIGDYFPDWIDTVRVSKKDGRQELVVCNRTATLVYLAQQACITLHPWLSRTSELDHPDLLVFDLDPPGEDFGLVRRGAFRLRELLDELDLPSFVKTTGSRGLHVVVPLDRKAGFDAVRSFARDVTEVLAGRYPEELTTEQRKDKRRGRLFLDAGRNAYAQTAVAPYSVREKGGAPVAAPLEWDELKDSRIDAQSFNIRNMLKRLDRRDDPWQQLWRRARSITAARRRLARLKQQKQDRR